MQTEFTPRDMARFWSKVDRTGDACWEWTAKSRTRKGYGVFNLGGRSSPYRYFLAHRASWWLHYGQPPPSDLCVCHTCDNRLCVRPDHLWLGTNRDNLQDMWRKGRARPGHPIGESNGYSKLTAPVVAYIRGRYAAGGISQQAIADEIGVHQSAVSAVVRRKTWGHVH